MNTILDLPKIRFLDPLFLTTFLQKCTIGRRITVGQNVRYMFKESQTFDFKLFSGIFTNV